MLYTVSQFKDSVAGMVSGIDLSNIPDLYGCFERAARTLCQKADIPEASGIQNITLYSGVFNYVIDPRVYGTDIVDIRPQGISRNIDDSVLKTNQADFDRTKDYKPTGTTSTFEYNNGIPTIRVVASFPTQQVIISPMTTSQNWSATGTASGVATDNTFFYQYPGSIRFNLATNAGATSGGITTTLQSQLDLSRYLGVAKLFLAVECPDVSHVTSYTLRIGSSSSDYYEMTQSTPFLGSFVSGQFQLVGFDFSSYTTVGTPDITKIQYVYVVANYDGTALTNMRFGDLFASLPSPAQILYQSAAIFIASGSTTSSTQITSDTDTIMLNNPAYNLFLFEGAISVLEQSGADNASGLIGSYNGKLNGQRARNGSVINPGLYDLYRGDNPSQQLRQSGTWYDNSPSYGNTWI